MRLSRGLLASVVAIAASAPIMAPQLLAFPYHALVGASEVWSEAPLEPVALARVLTRRDVLIATSPLARLPESRHIFLTRGGWRWLWLANFNHDGFGLTRAPNEAVIINRSNVATDRVYASTTYGGIRTSRTLSGVIAHETCHGMERHYFGVAIQFTISQQVFEGYCDFVAQESSLTDGDVAKLRAEHRDHPALPYYEGRRRVAKALAANGNNVTGLFEAN